MGEPSTAVEPGSVVGGRYLLQSPLGRGGMGTVWRAEHLTLARPVAVKFLDQARCDDRAACDRFLREARIAAAVRHRNVVDILDFGATNTGVPYMVMELLEGRTLGDLAARAPRNVGETVRITVQVLAGLAAVHAAGIFHGDLKPDNIMLVREGEGEDASEVAKLVDFGVSRTAGSKRRLKSVVPSEEKLLAGTPWYMSPEQARVESLDARSDLYSLAVIVYELLAGRLPFESDSPVEVLAQVLRDEAPRLSFFRGDLPEPIVEFVHRAMARERTDRYKSANAMRVALIAAAARAYGEGQGHPDSNDVMRELGDAYQMSNSGLIPILSPDALARDAAINDPSRQTIERRIESFFPARPSEIGEPPVIAPIATDPAPPRAEPAATPHPVARRAAFAMLVLAAIAGIAWGIRDEAPAEASAPPVAIAAARAASPPVHATTAPIVHEVAAPVVELVPPEAPAAPTPELEAPLPILPTKRGPVRRRGADADRLIRAPDF